jgi:deoxyribonuclease V
MKFRRLHPWVVSTQQALEIQRCLQHEIRLMPLPDSIEYVAGIDVSYSKVTGTLWGGVVVFAYRDLVRIEEKWAKGQSVFPYVSGLLSFREIPVLLQALKQIRTFPDVILCDGQGIAHPRGVGIAAHLGLVLDTPTVGCAKSRLVGDSGAVGGEKGNFAPLRYEGRTVGAVLRTRAGAKPIFVSPGFKLTFKEAIAISLNCTTKYRIPEPIRSAHLLVNKLRREAEW